jgi:phenylalanine-4-hydroxylase
MRTQYRIDSFQSTYFVITGFEQLFEATAPDFTPLYERVSIQAELGAQERLATDTVY